MVDEMTVRPESTPAILEGYVQQGKMFLFNAAQNLIQYGRVLVEAKNYVPHGQFGSWVAENFGMSERSAQGYMAVWKRFGKNEQLKAVQFSSLQKMLSLPEGTENQFAAEYNLKDMTAREVECAVKRARAAADEEIQKERRARMEAEQRAAAAEKAKNQPSAELRSELHNNQTRIAQQEAEIERLAKAGSIAAGEAERLRRELKEQTELLEEQQAEINRAQQEILNMQSAAAKGDAERTPESQLTLEAFSSAVRVFIGTCARLPMMRFAFAAMGPDDLREYRVLLETVEKWAKDSREAMALDVIDGGVNDV